MKACVLVFVFSCMGCGIPVHGQELSPEKYWMWPGAPVHEDRISVSRLRHTPPGKALSAFKRGYRHALHQNAKQAAMEFEHAVTLDPEFSEAHSDLGGQYVLLGHLDKAAAHYRRAVELDATTSIYHSNLAVLLAMQRQYEQATAEAQTAFALDASNPIARYMLGWESTRRSQNLDEAITHLKFAASKIREARFILAIALRKKGDFRSARNEMETYLKSSPPPGDRKDIELWKSALVPR